MENLLNRYIEQLHELLTDERREITEVTFNIYIVYQEKIWYNNSIFFNGIIAKCVIVCYTDQNDTPGGVYYGNE